MLLNETTCCTVICSHTLHFDAAENGSISIFALDQEVHGVTVCGLQYALNDATLTNDFPLGVSNAFIGQNSSITVRKGAICVIWQRLS